MTTRISLGRKITYGLGDVGLHLFFLTASLYLLYYYTDVMGLPPATAGWVFAAALIWDAVLDPVVGALANRTRSRWGRYRPYLLFAAVPLGASWTLIFLPTDFTGVTLVVFAAAAHILFRTVYTFAAMPYLALMAAMTEDSTERSSLAAFRLFSAACAGIFIAFMTLQLVAMFGGGQVGFLRVALLYSTLAAALLVLVFFTAREVVEVEARTLPTFSEMIAMLKANRAFWLVCGALLAGSMANVFFNKTIPYFFKYSLAREDLIGPALGILTGMLTLSIPLWTVVMKRSSKRLAFLIGTGIAALAYLLIWLAPQQPGAIMPLLALLGLGIGAIYLSTWAMMPDTVEFGEWRTGVRAEGAIFGFVSLAQKTSLALGAGLLGETLDAVGFVPNAAQSPETLRAIGATMVAVPATFALIAGACILFYPLDARTHGRLVSVLKWRRARKAAASVAPPPVM